MTTILIIDLYQLVKGFFDFDKTLFNVHCLIIFLSFSAISNSTCHHIRMVHLGQLQVLVLDQLDVDRLGRFLWRNLKQLQTVKHLMLHQSRHLAKCTVTFVVWVAVAVVLICRLLLGRGAKAALTRYPIYLLGPETTWLKIKEFSSLCIF